MLRSRIVYIAAGGVTVVESAVQGTATGGLAARSIVQN
jgi:hypothetical protein